MPTTLTNYGGRSTSHSLAESAARYAGQRAYDYVTKNGIPAGRPKKYTRKGLRGGNTTKQLKKEVRLVKKSIKDEMSTHSYTNLSTGVISCNSGNSFHTYIGANTSSFCELALAGLKFFDPATPNTLVTASGASGSYSRGYEIKSTYSRLMVKNNYQIPVKVSVYVVKPKGDTGVDPVTAFESGLADQGAQSDTSVLVHLTDSVVFNELWKIEKKVSRTLLPGKDFEVNTSSKPFIYNPATYDTHQLIYQPQWKSSVFVIRLEGVLAHDSAGAVSTTEGSIDYKRQNKVVVSYDSGTPGLRTLAHTDNMPGAFTGAGLVSQVVVDNQSYSST